MKKKVIKGFGGSPQVWNSWKNTGSGKKEGARRDSSPGTIAIPTTALKGLRTREGHKVKARSAGYSLWKGF